MSAPKTFASSTVTLRRLRMRLCALAAFMFSCTTQYNAYSAPPILPGATGFGIDTVAGSGRHLPKARSSIYIITNLRDEGPRSLRDCVNQRGPRTCLFATSGQIFLSKAIRIKNPFITIAGQTAPRPGITLRGAGLSVETHDVLIQHLAIRPGDSRGGQPPEQRDGVSIGAAPPRTAFNVVLDHLSLTWATDENASTAYSTTHDITISHSLIAEGLHRSIHPKGPHSKGLMIGDGSKRISILRNVLAFNEERNPYLKPDTSTEFINNVVYGWGPNGGWSLCNISNYDNSSLPIELTFIGNTYKPGPSSAPLWPLYAKSTPLGNQIFEADTIAPARPENVPTAKTASVISPPVASPGTISLPATQAYPLVLETVGSRPGQRSRIDSRIIADIQRGTGELKDCLSGCRRPAGSPRIPRQVWRVPKLPPKPFADTNKDGYTDLENWLHSRAMAVERLRSR